jgi:hypothetical protein
MKDKTIIAALAPLWRATGIVIAILLCASAVFGLGAFVKYCYEFLVR